MAKVRFGTRVGGIPTWSGDEGEALYVDKVRHLLWAWVPKRAGADWVGLDMGEIVTELSALDAATQGLFCISISTEQQARIEEKAPAELFAAPPFSVTQSDAAIKTATQDFSLSLSDYLHSEKPSVSVLRRLSWLASQRYEDFQRVGSEAWLARVSWDDLSNAPRPVVRDSDLFTTLKRCVEARHLVFLLGGYESGLTIFIDQFKDFLAKQQPANFHLTADFNSEHFRNVLEFLEKNPELLQSLQPIHTHTTALFISLAYSAYESIVSAQVTDPENLSNFIRAEAVRDLNVLIIRYLGQLAIGGSKGHKCQVGSFLSFLSGMMGASGRTGTLTILLSFPGLFKWLKQFRNEQVAIIVRRFLWRELQAFANTNYDILTGALKRNSALSSLAPQVGIIVELQRLPLTDIAHAFCHHSVLTLPPFSESEVRRMWDERIGSPIGDDDVSGLVHKTGGHPWFLDLLLRCVAIQSLDRTTIDRANVHEFLARATGMAETLLKGTDVATQQSEELRDKVQLYIKYLQRILTTETRTDSSELERLDRGRLKPMLISPSPRTEDWLESGLVWPRPPSNIPNTMLGIANYPYVETRRRGALAELVVERLMAKN